MKHMTIVWWGAGLVVISFVYPAHPEITVVNGC